MLPASSAIELMSDLTFCAHTLLIRPHEDISCLSEGDY